MDAPTLPDPATLFDLLADTVVVVDEHGLILQASASCEALLGYSPDELRGRYMIELVRSDERGATLNSVWRIMAGMPITRFENHWVHRDGHSVRLQWVARWSAEHRVRVAVAREIEEPVYTPV